jgi:protein-tyrosine phosphatase
MPDPPLPESAIRRQLNFTGTDTALNKILFLCHGNICRSPAAEILFNDEAAKAGIADRVRGESAALSTEAVGLGIYRPMLKVLKEAGFANPKHVSRQVTRADIDSSSLVAVMDSENLELYRELFGDYGIEKVKLLRSFAGGGEIDDPWYTREFSRALDEIHESVRGLVRAIAEKGL